MILEYKKRNSINKLSFFFGDPYGNRTHVTAVKGPCLNRLTNGPYVFSVSDLVTPGRIELPFSP